MKLIFAIMLFVGVAAGQTSRAQIGSVKIYDSNDPWSIPDSTIGREYFTIAFLQLYSRYEAECYADSTRHERTNEIQAYSDDGKAVPDTGATVIIMTGCPEGIPGCCVLHWKTVPRYSWTHREESFAGFRKWMHKKIKEGK